MAHFGSPFAEQRVLESGNAFVELNDHGLLSITGPDRLKWLDSITSQQVSRLQPGQSSETLLLDPKGHIEFALRLVDDGEQTWVLLDPEQADPLAEFLNRMRFTLRVDVHDLSDTHQTFGFFTGGSAETALAALQLEAQTFAIWHDPWQDLVQGGWQYAAEDSHPASQWRYAEVVVPNAAAAELVRAVRDGSVQVAGFLAREALRISAWRPSRSLEVDDRSLPHEVDWLRSAVHLNKGCYRGQETVAKVHNLGHPPRRLVMLHLDGSDALLPSSGDLIFVAGDDRAIGRITSAARHMDWGAIALALLKRSVPEDAALEVECESSRVPATQEVIVPQNAGATRDVPRLPRR